MKLTAEQTAIVGARHARILVNAYAGTGKTETTAHRVVSLVRDRRKVLLLCFTKAAQQQLETRLASMDCPVKVMTLHSFAHEVLRRYFERKGQDMPSLAPDGLLRKVILRSGHNPTSANIEAVRRASTFVANGMTTGFPQSSDFDGATCRLLVERYAKEKELLNQVDYDDLISMAACVVRPWKGEIIVDEAQDLSNLQINLLDKLTGPETSITWVGDRFQSIYSFAGVSSELFGNRSHWTQYGLTQSFRSAAGCLTVANQLIPSPIVSTKLGGTVSVYAKDQAGTIDHLIENHDKYNAILARTNTELQHISANLKYCDVPHNTSPYPANDAIKKTSGLVLSTIHSAKGLEWDSVAVVGLSSKGFKGFDATPEEKRLFYVASTRSKQALALFTENRLPFGVGVND